MMRTRSTQASSTTLLGVLLYQKFGTLELAEKATGVSHDTLMRCSRHDRRHRTKPRTTEALERAFGYPIAELLAPVAVKMTVSRG